MSFDKAFYDDAVDVYANIGGSRWKFVECEVVLSKATTPDNVQFVAIPDADADVPSNPQKTVDRGGLVGAPFKLYASSALREVEDYLIFTGRLSNISNTIVGAWDGTAHDKTHYKLSKSDPSSIYNQDIDIQKAVNDGDVTNNKVKGKVEYDIPSTQTKIYQIDADEMVNEVMERVGITDYGIIMSEDGIDVGGPEPAGKNKYLAFSTKKVSAGEIIERILESTNSEMWFDRRGTLYIGAPQEGFPIDTFDIKFITDTNAGLTTPPYQSVQVVGSGVVSEDGWRSQAIVEDRPYVTRQNVSDSKRDTGDLQKPTFTYRNMSIQTQEEAISVREKLISKIKQQSAKGSITVVGHPEIRPYDTVSMPDTDVQPFGNQTFGVYKVTHRFTDGFTTKINVSGLTPEEESISVSSDEFNDLIDQFARRASDPSSFRSTSDGSYDPVDNRD